MKINLIIPDATYASLISGTCRIQGSIGLVSPTECNFHPFRKRSGVARRYIKLAHGRISSSSKDIRLTLCIPTDEAHIEASRVINEESLQASALLNYLNKEEEKKYEFRYSKKYQE